VGASRAVYPGTFDPVTPGHLDVVDRARRLFSQVTVLVSVNGAKEPASAITARAAAVRQALPAAWTNVSVAAWEGLTVTYCVENNANVIVRGVRNPTDITYEYELAVMNQELGITTLLMPTRPSLAAISSTVVRSRNEAARS
jgi:pantetheine-phosphate adenylyltransferase